MCLLMYVMLRNIRQYTNVWSTERGIYDVGRNFNTMVKLDPPTCIHTRLGLERLRRREHLEDLGINGSVQITPDFEESEREGVYWVHLAHVTYVW